MASCKEFYQATHPNWTAGDWESMNSIQGSAVPLAGPSHGVPVVPDERSRNDGSRGFLTTTFETNEQGASSGLMRNWKEFYTQEIGDLVYAMYRSDFESFGYSREVFRN
jgi:hypothetical protein